MKNPEAVKLAKLSVKAQKKRFGKNYNKEMSRRRKAGIKSKPI